MAETNKAPPTPKFRVGEEIAAMHTNAIYPATVKEIKEHKGELKYLIHFTGWNRRYDERIPVGKEAGKMFAKDAAPRDAVVEPHLLMKKSAKMREGGSVNGDATTPVPPKKGPKTRFTVPSPPPILVDHEEGSSAKIDLPNQNPLSHIKEPTSIVNLPQSLRKILVDDFELINRGYLVKESSSKNNIDQIITDYIKTIAVGDKDLTQEGSDITHENGKETRSTNVGMVLAARGLLDYFNATIGYQMLYRGERSQYNDLVARVLVDSEGHKRGQVPLPDEQFRASNYYGIIHLVRMLARIEDLLKMSSWNDFLQGRIMSGVDDLLGFLDKNLKKYYKGAAEYMTADTDYHTRILAKNDDEPTTSSN
ncbi:unnamed protein product [Caenorhabditis brenneri]